MKSKFSIDLDKKMGGKGSGTHIRKNTKDQVENYLSLNMTDISTPESFHHSGFKVCRWSKADASMNIVICLHPDYLSCLLCHYYYNECECLELIKLDITYPHFGGNRYWFLCPSCSKRYLKLPLKSGKLKCRKCHALNYCSQQERPPFQALRQAQKIYSSLEAEQPFLFNNTVLFKPKHMHNNVFVEKQIKMEWYIEKFFSLYKF